MFISIQGPALRTYNRVSNILSGLWTKLHSYPAIEVSMNVLVACLMCNLSRKCVFRRNICWFVWNLYSKWWTPLIFVFLLWHITYSKFVHTAFNAWPYDIHRRQLIIKQSLRRSRITVRLSNWQECGTLSNQALFFACRRTVTLVCNISLCAYVWNLCNKQAASRLSCK